MTRVAHAEPTKQFFVDMITRDISLEACILDLLDNSLDGARGDVRARDGDVNAEDAYKGYYARLRFGVDHFFIEDNCGGISTDDAENYAFYFGRRPDANPEAPYGIGIYGIGMKRAVFKIGRNIEVRSSTDGEAFLVPINVDRWLEPDTTWDFPLIPEETWEESGTKISIGGVYSSISAEFADPDFQSQLIRVIARDYSFFLQKGFSVEVNGVAVVPFVYRVQSVPEQLEAANAEFNVDGIHVRLIAGMASLPQEDIDPEARPVADPRYFGWFVVCNDRVVLAADKTNATVWGNDFPNFHTQYYGFMGLCFFNSDDPSRLPWTTTKRGVDTSHSLYRRAITEMKKLTRPYLTYTDRRKDSPEIARATEARAVPVPVSTLRLRPEMRLPDLPAQPRIRLVSIQFKRPEEEIKRVAKTLGNPYLAAKEVGERTYEYYLENYVEEG